MRTIAAVALLLLAPLTALAQAKPGGKIVFAARQDIDTLDPHITNRAATRKILIQFTDTLTVINPKDGKVLPGLAESWEVARDGKSYTFKLRHNVKFHDGTPFDAAAVKFTFDRIQEPLGAPAVARAFLGPYAHGRAADRRGPDRRGSFVRRRGGAGEEPRRADPAWRAGRHAVDDLPQRPALSYQRAGGAARAAPRHQQGRDRAPRLPRPEPGRRVADAAAHAQLRAGHQVAVPV